MIAIRQSGNSRYKHLIAGPFKVCFGGGQPKFFKVPRFARWGKALSIFWLGKELVIFYE